MTSPHLRDHDITKSRDRRSATSPPTPTPHRTAPTPRHHPFIHSLTVGCGCCAASSSATVIYCDAHCVQLVTGLTSHMSSRTHTRAPPHPNHTTPHHTTHHTTPHNTTPHRMHAPAPKPPQTHFVSMIMMLLEESTGLQCGIHPASFVHRLTVENHTAVLKQSKLQGDLNTEVAAS